MRRFFTHRPGPISFILLGSIIVVLLILIPLTSIFVVSNVASHPLTQLKPQVPTQHASNIGTSQPVTASKTTPATSSTSSSKPTQVATSIARITPTASRPLQPTPTHQSQPGGPSPQFSFEDGLIDSWQAAGPVIIQNSTEHAEDGGHSLKASFTALAASNYPYVSVPGSNISNPYPQVGQTLKAYIYIPVGSPSTSAWWFVVDSSYAWHKGAQQSLTSGMWNQVTFAMPTINSQPSRIGLQFATASGGTAYIDAISWN